MSRSWLLLVPLAVIACLGCGKPPPPEPPPPGGMMATPWIAPGVRRPDMRTAADAGLDDDAPVVGVVVAGKARAYSLKALSNMNRRVVNDLIGEVPVTVTYCDLSRCIRVITDEGKHALDVGQGGRGTDGLLLRYGGVMYSQATGQRFGTEGPPFPLPSLPYEETTWKAWRDKHPDTEVYTGQ